MPLRLYNSLTRGKDDFAPSAPPRVSLYTCGPTVYNYQHVGNYRTYVFEDVLVRTLKLLGFEPRRVMNITDVGHLTSQGDEGEDKMEVGAAREGKSAWEIAKFYTDAFLSDCKELNLLPADTLCKATDHIPEQIAMIEAIEKAGYTYATSDGIYFDTSKLSEYGKLSGQALDEKVGGMRVAIGEKRHGADFALWKFSPEGEKRQMEWESPWGKGFPGWHIECSAMSEKYLGVPFDIHTGGVDHIAVHHENEIAQTLAARGKLEANVWLHNEFLMVDGGKMSKSIGNTYSLDDFAERGIAPLAFRLFVLGAHYRTQQNFTWDAINAAQNAFVKLVDACRDLPKPAQSPDAATMERFTAHLADDLDTPGALAVLWTTLGSAMEPSKQAATLLAMDEILGLALEDVVARPVVVPEAVEKLVAERERARDGKDWEHADELRDAIAQLGYRVEDAPSGQRVREG